MNPVAKSRTYKMILVALFAALIAVGAFIRVPVPLVPFTMQTFFVVLAGMLLGKKLGAASALVYLAIGLIGIPVFTQGGIGYVLKPSFGYLIGFIVAAFITGAIVRRWKIPASGGCCLARRSSRALCARHGILLLPEQLLFGQAGLRLDGGVVLLPRVRARRSGEKPRRRADCETYDPGIEEEPSVLRKIVTQNAGACAPASFISAIDGFC